MPNDKTHKTTTRPSGLVLTTGEDTPPTPPPPSVQHTSLVAIETPRGSVYFDAEEFAGVTIAEVGISAIVTKGGAVIACSASPGTIAATVADKLRELKECRKAEERERIGAYCDLLRTVCAGLTDAQIRAAAAACRDVMASRAQASKNASPAASGPVL